MNGVEISALTAEKVPKALWRRILASRFLRHVGVLTAANGVSAALTLVQGVLVARWLGPELYGLAALVMSIPSLAYSFFDARSSEASVRYLSEFHARGERERAVAMCRLGYAIDLAVAGVAFVGIFALAPWAARTVVHHPEVAWLLVIYGAAFLPRSLVGTSYAVLASLGRFPAIALVTTGEAGIRTFLVLGLVLAGWGVTGVIWGNALAMALTGALYSLPAILLLRRTWGTLPWAVAWQTLKGHRRDIGRFLAYNDLNALLGMIPKQLDLILLGYFRNPVEVGYYKLAKGAAGMVRNLVGPLQSVAYPELARLRGRGDQDGLRAKVSKLARCIGAPAGLVVVAGTLLVPWMLPTLVGQAYRPAIVAAQWLLIGSAIWLAFFWLRPMYLAMARVREWGLGIGLYACAFLVLSVFTIPQWGYKGAALSQLAVIAVFHSLMGLAVYVARAESGRPL